MFRNRRPRYGEDYGRGWIGFNHADSWMSKAIAHGTRPLRDSGITVSHVFIVTGEDKCIEAAFSVGVIETNLTSAYFDREDRYVCFRQPRGMTDEIADRIVATAEEELGTEFNNSAIASNALVDNYAGWLINRLFNDKPQEFIASLAKSDDRWICSELAAYCLNCQEEYKGRGVLDHPTTAIEPQRLFEDDQLFEPLDATGPANG